MDDQPRETPLLEGPAPPREKTPVYCGAQFSKDFITGLATLAAAIGAFVVGPPLFMLTLKIGKWLLVSAATLLLLVIITAIVGRVVNWLLEKWTQ